MEENTYLNFVSFLYVVDVELFKKSLQKNSNMTANLCHEKSQSLESSTEPGIFHCRRSFLNPERLLDSGCHGSAQTKII